MKNEEILEGNKLIAIFMGMELVVFKAENEVEKGWRTLNVCSKSIKQFSYIPNEFRHIPPNKDASIIEMEAVEKMWRFISNNAKYNTSFDWIMPVVDKIEAIENENEFDLFSVQIEGLECSINNCVSGNVDFYSDGKTKLEAVFTTVVQFIKWYNSKLQ